MRRTLTRYASLSRGAQIRRMRQLAERALSLYAIEPASLSLLTHAYNTTFAVRGPDSGRCVLHILRPPGDFRSEAQWRARVESELWWADRVRVDLDLSVPAAVRSPQGESVVNVDGEGMGPTRLCTLFHWVDGRFLHRRFTRAHLEEIGRLTATLHHHSERLRVPAWFDRPTVDRSDVEVEERVAQLFTDHVSVAAAEVMRKVVRRPRQAQHELGTDSHTFGLIHADIHQKNYLFSGREVRLIDFGDCGWGHYLYDLAVTVSELADLPHRRQLRAALLAGYRQVRDLTSAHEALIDTFILLREAQNVTWFVDARDDPSYRRQAAQIGDGVTVLERLLAAGA